MNAIKQAIKKLPVAAIQQDQQQCIPLTTINVQIHGCLARIAISGRFDFQAWRNFKNSYTPLLDNTVVREIFVEMSKVDYLEASAMGMLLLLNERAKAANKQVALRATCGAVSRVLEGWRFQQNFLHQAH